LTGDDWINEFVEITDERIVLNKTALLLGQVSGIVVGRHDYGGPYSSVEVRRMQAVLSTLARALERAASISPTPMNSVKGRGRWRLPSRRGY
jgi:hypothetical protein